MKRLITLLTIFLLSTPAFATELQTAVLSILDGDTLIIQTTNGPTTVHIGGFESPEPGQPFFEDAKALTTKLINGKPVTISAAGKIENQSIVKISTANHKNIPLVLISSGLGWVAKPVRPTEKEIEIKARMKHIGIWSKPNPESPWAYRARYNKKSAQSVRVGTEHQPINLYGDSAKDIPRDQDGSAVGEGGGFLFSNQGVPFDPLGGLSGYRESKIRYNNNNIKRDCQDQWGKDYRMVRYCINKQTTAKNSLKGHRIDREILQFCEDKWGEDWSMVKYCYGNQKVAKSRLERN